MHIFRCINQELPQLELPGIKFDQEYDYETETEYQYEYEPESDYKYDEEEKKYFEQGWRCYEKISG